ncbi:MAG: hypothetical protein AMXMBFR37_09920 [Steroidobacteraceae bacterium]
MTAPAIDGVRRHFVTIGQRQLHYRRAGNGPPLVLLHRLPRSSQDLTPLLLRWRESFTVIAPDQAGYGQSWPLPPQADGAAPEARAYVDDLRDFLDALGLDRVHLLGDGTGALLALGLAQQHAGRVASLVCHDLPESPVDAATLRRAFAPFEPRWDGSHLAWLWAMLREEAVFDPWQEKSLAHRRFEAIPDAERLQERAVQFLSGGHHGRGYELGLRALLALDAAALLATATVPVLRLDAQQEAAAQWARADEWLRERRSNAGTPPVPAVQAIPGMPWSDYAAVDGGQLHFHCNTDGDTLPLLVQHDAASSVGTVAPITRSLVGVRSVFAFDLPGSGDSDNLLGGRAAGVEDYADILERALLALGAPQVDFYGMWGGGFVGLELALRQRQRVRRLVMSNVFFHEGEELRLVQQHYTPDVTPLWHGGHLLQCWHQMRDQGLFFPWFDRSARGALRREPFIDTAMVHERVCSLLKAGNMYRTAYQAHFTYPVLEKLRRSPVPTLVATSTWDPNRTHTEVAAREAPDASFRLLDADFSRWGLSFVDFLSLDG